MTTPYLGEIRMFGGNFAPVGWALCHGQLLDVSQHESLFSVIGTIYGGDGRTTFGLPDLRGRVPLHYGSGVGLTPRAIGARGGSETEILTVNQLPSHSHAPQAMPGTGNSSSPAGAIWAAGNSSFYTTDTSTSGTMATGILEEAYAGAAQPHNNVMPSTVINFIIALVGLIPSQT